MLTLDIADQLLEQQQQQQLSLDAEHAADVSWMYLLYSVLIKYTGWVKKSKLLYVGG